MLRFFYSFCLPTVYVFHFLSRDKPVRALSISQNSPARPVYSRTEFRCWSDLSCQISRYINIILCRGGFVGKSRAKGLFHSQNHRIGLPVLTNGKRPKFTFWGEQHFIATTDYITSLVFFWSSPHPHFLKRVFRISVSTEIRQRKNLFCVVILSTNSRDDETLFSFSFIQEPRTVFVFFLL